MGLVADLKRPGGGWTTGILTLSGAGIAITLDAASMWPGPSWSAFVVAAVFLLFHMSWGAYGYYPRRI